MSSFSLVPSFFYILQFYFGCSRTGLLPVEDGDAIVVTGAHTGIGKHAALTLAKEGFTVFAGVRKLAEHGEELTKSAEHFGIDSNRYLIPILLDVTNKTQIDAAVETVSDYLGENKGLYGLFNNAGIGKVHGLEMHSLSVEYAPLEYQRGVFEVNYFGTVQVTKAFLPLLRKRHNSRILSTSSLSGLFAGPFNSAYSASKFAIEAFQIRFEENCTL